MDAVYILGNGSSANNEELRYSIRSLDQHMIDLENIYIVGSKPQLNLSCKHLSADDPFSKPWRNALWKTRAACGIEYLSSEFLLMNDDFFMLSDFMGSEYPFHAVKNGNGGSSGRNDFSIHCPMRINRDMYLKMPLDVEIRGDYSPRSFYANFYGAPPTFVEDTIVRTGERMKPFDEQVKSRDFFSIDDTTMLDDKFVFWLQEMYPMRSRFEIE